MVDRWKKKSPYRNYSLKLPLKACIEVIMYLEECTTSMTDIVSNSELLVACYYIIESAVSYMASDRLKQLDRRQRDQVGV